MNIRHLARKNAVDKLFLKREHGTPSGQLGRKRKIDKELIFIAIFFAIIMLGLGIMGYFKIVAMHDELVFLRERLRLYE